ncbi:hypothetical protein IFR05_010498 [Cadophora sp. M221]|nr:hypothetical protein IFR05_010498 [Cadophora sp. M221]
MKSSNLCLLLAGHLTLSSALYQPQMRARQEDEAPGFDPAFAYLFRMCSPETLNIVNNNTSGGAIFPGLAQASAPCDQRDYIIGSCIANGTVPELDFAAEQQCFCGSNFWEAWLGCEACYRAHGYPEILSEDDVRSWASSMSSAECLPTPYPSAPFRNLFTIAEVTSVLPRITLGEDKFPNQTAASNYWTKSASPTPVLGSITGIATGRATERTGPGGIYAPTESVSGSSDSAAITSSPTLSGSGSASRSGTGSAAGVSTSASTAGVAEFAVGGGVVLVVVNVVAVILL